MVPGKTVIPARTGRVGGRIAVALLLAGSTMALGSPVHAAHSNGFNTVGNIVIADQYNNRVIEVDAHHNVVWSFGSGSSKAGPNSIVAPNDAERFGNLTLIAGTGAPPNSEPTCPPPNGCPDNRVIIVNQAGKIVWQYGQAGVGGSGFDQLNTPVSDVYLPNGNVLITDQVNERVIEVTGSLQIVWQYGTTGVSGSGANQLNNPNMAELLPNGNVLISDENNNRAIEVTHSTPSKIVWQYNKGMNLVAFASRLSNGNTLITDSGNNRIVEINSAGKTVFTYYTNKRSGSVSNPLPTRAVRLRNGNTLISDQYNHQVIEINPKGSIVFSQGQIGVSGNGPNQLNGPYDAKVVGDYTGLTLP